MQKEGEEGVTWSFLEGLLPSNAILVGEAATVPRETGEARR